MCLIIIIMGLIQVTRHRGGASGLETRLIAIAVATYKMQERRIHRKVA